jgi:hypothetical protein
METPYFRHPLRFPKNADGPFYTTGHPRSTADDPTSPTEWCGDCLWCGAPEAEAPNLLAPFDDSYTDTYFVRQPATPGETEQAIVAARVCCVSAIRYGGRDHDIIEKLGNNPEMCDYFLTESGELKCTVADNGVLLPFAQAIVDEWRAEYQRQLKKQQKKWWLFWR